MAQSRIAFGEYLPDVAPLMNQGLTKALNTVPIAGGYASVRSLNPLTGFSVLPAAPKGAIASIDASGNPFNFVGTADNIFRLSTDDNIEKVSVVDDSYNCSGECRWEFDVLGDNVIAVNPNDVTQVLNVVTDAHTGSRFAKLGNDTNGDAPRAAHIGTIGTFIILGNTFDSINGLDETAIHWPALNDPYNWPTPGTEAAVAVQSDRQPLEGNGGAVQRVVSGSEVGGIFQERAIWRTEYRGGDVVFELTRVEPNRGLLIPAFAVPFGRSVFYYSEDGFYMWDYTSSEPIGRERVDRTFAADIKQDFLHRCSAVSDPDTQRIWMAYPGDGSTSGNPNKILMYDWGLNKFTHGDEAVEILTQVVGIGVHLDSPAGTGDELEDIDTSPELSSFDARIKGVGGRKLGAYSPTYQISDFSGLQRPGTLETGRRELIPGRRAFVSGAQVLVDSADPTVQVAPLSRTNEETVFGGKSPVNTDTGFAPLRADGRYHVFRVNLPRAFENALGLDVSAQESGTR